VFAHSLSARRVAKTLAMSGPGWNVIELPYASATFAIWIVLDPVKILPDSCVFSTVNDTPANLLVDPHRCLAASVNFRCKGAGRGIGKAKRGILR